MQRLGDKAGRVAGVILEKSIGYMVGKFELGEAWDCTSADGPSGGTYLENVFMEVMVEGMTLQREKMERKCRCSRKVP